MAGATGSLGMALKGRGNLEQAIAGFREAIRLLPNNAVSHRALGFALMDQGKPDEAIASFTKAIRLVPALAVAYLGRARAYRAIGDEIRAESDEHKARELCQSQGQQAGE